MISALGVVAFIALAWALSNRRRAFPWRTVLWGLSLQLLFALLILHTDPGRAAFDLGGRGITRLNDFAAKGNVMVFGPLGEAEALDKTFGQKAILGIVITGTIILVAALSSLLYHWGILQRVVQATAWLMQRAMRTSGSETLAVVANIFMGQTEAPLVIRPYLARMTQSELMCLMVGGMATIAGGVAAVYAGFGRAVGNEAFAGHLLTASVISAPAALMIAKIMMPETQPSETVGHVHLKIERTATNSIDALCRGASDGMILSINVLAMLICFVAVVAMANWLITWPQIRLGVSAPVNLEQMVGWLNAPFAWLMGIPAADCLKVGEILGQRVVLNEFIGYVVLTSPETRFADPRSFTLATYALCGFANFTSIAIQIGGIGSLVPERRGDLARIGLRAMIGGLLACYLTAAVVGTLL